MIQHIILNFACGVDFYRNYPAFEKTIYWDKLLNIL